MEAAKLTSSHPNAAQDIEWKRHELEEAWANLREQVFNGILFIYLYSFLFHDERKNTQFLLSDISFALFLSQAAARKGKLRDSYDYFHFLNEFR